MNCATVTIGSNNDHPNCGLVYWEKIQIKRKKRDSMTKTQKLIVGLFALLIGVHASSAIQTVSVMDYKGPHGLGGGEFTLKNTGTEAIGIVQVGQTWQTFCLEYVEHIGMGFTYDVKINSGAISGGFSGQAQPNYDPLDSRTAYLYSLFTHNAL